MSDRRRTTNNLVMNLFKIVIGLLVTLVFYLFCLMGKNYPGNEVLLFVLMFYAGSLTLARIYDAISYGEERISELVVSQAVTIALTHIAMFIAVCILERPNIRLWGWALSGSVSMVLSMCWTILANRVYFKLFPPLHSIVVYGELRSSKTLEMLYTYPKKFRVEKAITTEDLAGHFNVLLNYDAVFINEVPSGQRNDILKYCVANSIKVYVRPKIGDLLLSASKQVKLLGLPVVTMKAKEPHQLYSVIKRIQDMVAASVGLIFTSPIFLVVALLIKLHDGGQVFYKQQRLTKDGKVFTLYKFRSMREDAEADGVARLASENDNRITPIGCRLRATRLDELPQLFNVLKGDMSLVGPRPERPEIAEQYAKDFPEFNLRLKAKAGLTGFAQVHGRYNTEPYTKLQMDLIYIANQNLFTDLKLIFATFRILFLKESTEGVEDGMVTAKEASPSKDARVL